MRKTLMALTAGLAIAGATPSGAAAQEPATDPTAMVCTNGPDFTLAAGTGRMTTPDGNDVFMWGFGDLARNDAFQLPGPVLCVTQGERVTVTLENRLSQPTSISFPGQTGVRATGGTAGVLGPEASPGGTLTYSFVAGEPGTYLYESGSNPAKQVHMGLYGALVVRPTRGPNFAYDDARTEFDPAREYIAILHDIDPFLHQAVERGQAYDHTAKHDRYWTINGRSFPDTIADNGAAWLPQQPYSSLMTMRPYTAGNGKPALVRYINAGLVNHPFHPHGNHMRMIGRDGRLLQGPGGTDASSESFTRTVASGQTYDLLFSWSDADGFDPVTNPVPVTLPSARNLTFKDGSSYYSGSPYLGRKGALPANVQSYNECGEYYFPLHSHALNEFANYDAGFGGMATLARIEPSAGCP